MVTGSLRSQDASVTGVDKTLTYKVKLTLTYHGFPMMLTGFLTVITLSNMK